MGKSNPIKPNGEFPSLEDYKSGDISDKWKRYFDDITNMISPRLRQMIASWSEVKAEALILINMLNTSNGEELDEYLKKNPVSTQLLCHLLMQNEKQFKSEFAKQNASIRLAIDEKQLAKKSIEIDFKNSNYPFDKHGYKAKFTNEMWEKYPIITSRKTIENLVTRLYRNTPSAS